MQRGTHDHSLPVVGLPNPDTSTSQWDLLALASWCQVSWGECCELWFRIRS